MILQERVQAELKRSELRGPNDGWLRFDKSGGERERKRPSGAKIGKRKRNMKQKYVEGGRYV